MTNLAPFPTRRYSAGAMAFHWSMALLIAGVGILGLLFDDMPKEWKASMINLHSALGCLILLLFVGRVWWRFTHRPPPLPAQTSPVSRQMSELGHLGLYVLMGLAPLVGLVYRLARGRGIDFGLFQITPLFDHALDFARSLGKLHSLSAYALLALAAGHILIALWHQYVSRDGTMSRMMPERKSAAVAAPTPAKAR